MHADRWRRVQELYHETYERPVHERGAFLDEVCAGDAGLREEIESLFAQPVSADGSLERAARGVALPTTARPFVVGARLGPYVITGPLGAGGMGEVYRARDRQLNRDVALKVLPELSALDPDRLARFRREAQILASLNHPNIGAIYGLADTDGIRALVLELVDGPTLADRIAQGPVPLHDALPIARQMCEALAAAHEQGVIHRDLKPANIKLRPDGTVKVLDFGLAKVFVGDGSKADLSRSLTVTLSGTQEGVILGTAAYMSPEQARGLTVDTRTDIWAFGCVLDEMLTGRALFLRPTLTDTLAAIVEREPAWDTLPAATPPGIRRLLQRCLEKDPTRRLRNIADARREIEDGLRGDARTAANTAVVVDPLRRRLRLWTIAVVTSLAALIAVGALTRYTRTAPQAQTAVWRWFAPSETPSVAVLPFSTIGAGDQYFADGITEAVTTELGRAGGLRVIASNSTFAYRDKTAFRDIGRELGVGLVVRGSVQRAGGMVRIDVSLVDARDDTVRWSERYNRELTDVLSVQDEISRQIATTLSKTVAPAPTAKLPSLSTTNPDAYDAYLHGLWHLKARSSTTPGRSRSRLVAAIEELNRAVAQDPNFSLARAVLGSAYTQQFFYNEADPALEQKAFLEIERAVAINPDQAEAYLARAQLTWNLRNGFHHESAIADLRHALSINPSLAEAYAELGKIYLHIGQTDKSVEANDQGQKLDPSAVPPASRKVSALVHAGRLDEVRLELDRHSRLSPVSRADALLAIGQLDEALQTLVPATSMESGDPEADESATALLAVVYARLGRREDAERAVAAASPVAENVGGLSHLHHAQFYVGSALSVLGRYDEAVRWLTKAVDEGFASYPRFSTDQTLAPLKGHAGFAALLARLRQDRDRWQKTL
jgi:TolB-like protein/tetratricopeptide (TPR) repeat protein